MYKKGTRKDFTEKLYWLLKIFHDQNHENQHTFAHLKKIVPMLKSHKINIWDDIYEIMIHSYYAAYTLFATTPEKILRYQRKYFYIHERYHTRIFLFIKKCSKSKCKLLYRVVHRHFFIYLLKIFHIKINHRLLRH